MSFLKTMLSGAMIFSTLTLGFPVFEAKQVDPKQVAFRTVYQFPNNSWIENMAVRSNGQILATDLARGNVYLVNPKNQKNAPPAVASFYNHTALTGIAEVEDDVFYVQGINDTSLNPFSFPAKSSTVWRIDMRGYPGNDQPKVTKVKDILDIGTPNGMTLLSKHEGIVLIADSTKGLIWALNVNTGDYYLAIDDPVLKPVQGFQTLFGVNGITVIGCTLYFSNLDQAVFGSFPIDPKTGKATGKPKIIATGINNADDFAIGKDGIVWQTENVSNALVRIHPDGKVDTILGGGNSTVLPGPVAARFGRLPWDKHILYVSTDGRLYGKNGPLTTDGKIIAIDTLKVPDQ